MRSTKNIKKKKLRPLGAISNELEPILEEMVVDHELQVHEILAIIKGYLECHYPESIEQYLDGTHPILWYTHKEVKK